MRHYWRRGDQQRDTGREEGVPDRESSFPSLTFSAGHSAAFLLE
jgi:hypothetical protein